MTSDKRELKAEGSKLKGRDELEAESSKVKGREELEAESERWSDEVSVCLVDG